MALDRKGGKQSPCMDGGDIAKYFGAARKAHVEKAPNSKLQNLRNKRKPATEKRAVRQSAKAPKSTAGGRSGPEFKG